MLALFHDVTALTKRFVGAVVENARFGFAESATTMRAIRQFFEGARAECFLSVRPLGDL
jgi:hypothetical protein